MATMRRTPPRARRARGSRDPETLRPLYAEIDQDVKATLDLIADGAGEPLWRVVEEITRHLQLDPEGMPVWWPARRNPQEELPLKTA